MSPTQEEIAHMKELHERRQKAADKAMQAYEQSLNKTSILEQAIEDATLLKKHAEENKKNLTKEIVSKNDGFYAECEYDFKTDTVLVKVRKRFFDDNGRPTTKGLIIRVPQEDLFVKPPSQEYIQKKLDRFESIIDEAE